MRLSTMLWFRVANDLLHDLTAGVVPGVVLALWMVRNGAKTALAPEATATLITSWSWIVFVIFLAIVVLVVTGAVRISYRTRNIREDAMHAQGLSAMIKHAVFVAVFVYATVVAFGILQT